MHSVWKENLKIYIQNSAIYFQKCSFSRDSRWSRNPSESLLLSVIAIDKAPRSKEKKTPILTVAWNYREKYSRSTDKNIPTSFLPVTQLTRSSPRYFALTNLHYQTPIQLSFLPKKKEREKEESKKEKLTPKELTSGAFYIPEIPVPPIPLCRTYVFTPEETQPWWNPLTIRPATNLHPPCTHPWHV